MKRARTTQETVPSADTDRGEAARAESVTKIYGTGPAAVTALDSVTVGFAPERFAAIMGPSGSGKSTLLHCLAGLDSVSSGRVFLGDRDITRMSEKELTQVRRAKVGFLFQAFNLLPALTVEENIGLPLSIAGKPVDRRWLKTVIDTVGLRDRLHHLPSELSGGQQQRTAAARALAMRPEIVFADEPTGNLDTRSSAELLSFMRRAVREFGQTILMVTHDPVSASYADRVVFLGDGRVVGELLDPTPEAVIDHMKELS
jgi:putative ABC transport system ATP-binding protein